MLKAATVILNWNTRELLERYLPSVTRFTKGDVIVADNGSTDGSLEMLQQKFPNVRTIALGSNFGFTGGYNRALKTLSEEGLYDVFVLMNSDIEVDSDWLTPLLEHLGQDSECAVCGPKLLRTDGRTFEYAGAAGGYLDAFAIPFCRGRVPGRVCADDGIYDRTCNVMWVSGACLAIRADVWNSLQGFDERFFAHMEEIDLCWRAGLEGWKVAVVPSSRVMHLGGGTLSPESPRKLMLNHRNNLLMLDNNLAASYRSRGFSRRRAAARASAFIFLRMAMDLGASLGHLLSLHPAKAGAVLDAHRQFRRLRGKRSTPQRTAAKEFRPMLDIWIIPSAIIKGKGIFKAIEKYEDRY